MPRTLKTCCWTSAVVDTDRAAADLDAVERQVVPARPHRLRDRRTTRVGAVNGWWIAVQRPASGSRSNIGKSTTHRSSWRSRGTRSKRSASSIRSAPSATGAMCRRSATNSSRSPSEASSSALTARDLLGGEELREVAGPAVALGRRSGATALAPWRWTTSLSPSSSERLISRAPALSARTTPLSDEHALEDLELAAAQQLADVVHLQAVAGVGLVAAEAQHRLVVGHPRPRRRRHLEVGRLEDRGHHGLGHADDVLLVDERHLDVELRELGWRKPRRSSSRKQRAIWK